MFTLNNYTAEDEQRLRDLECKYIVWGREVGESGTPHLQGYVAFTNPRTLRGASTAIPRAHLEPRRGTHEQARAYSTKDGDFEERGDPPRMGARSDISDFLGAVRGGASILALSEEHPVEYAKYHRAAAELRGQLGDQRSSKTRVEWYHGGTGTGKSRRAHEENDGAYWKDMSDGKWWDGYNGQEVVVFDDMRRDTFKFHELLRLFDRYPLRVQIKGGSTEFNSRKIIVTSSNPPELVYESRGDEDIAQLMRRIELVIRFPV